AQVRLVCGEGVRELDGSDLVEAQLVRDVRTGEAPPHDLVEALRGERVGRSAAQALPGGQPPGGAMPRRERHWQLLEPVQPRDLLDQVSLAGDVGATERRHG